MADPLVLEAVKAYRDELAGVPIDRLLSAAVAAESGCVNEDFRHCIDQLVDRQRKAGRLDKIVEEMETE